VQFVTRRRQRPSIDISPLVDVVFLLIIFFTVSTTFREGAGLPVTLPAAGTATAQPTGPIEVAVARDGSIAVAGEVYETIDGAEEALRAALAESEAPRISVRGDRLAPFERVVQVMDMARALGAQGMSLATAAPPPADEDEQSPARERAP
jgi:biopolymer transport protein ExbD